ncbi:MAG: hypothetical protein LQ347_004354, partial [Umbilicaria vellea]
MAANPPAPPSRSINCLAALSKCTRLLHLDLSLISESLSLSSLFHTLAPLTSLLTLHFPRSSTNDSRTNPLSHSWPPCLHTLHISGGLRDASLLYFCTVPRTLTSLTLSNSPHLSTAFVSPLLKAIGPHLTRLRIADTMPQLRATALDTILPHLPALHHLSAPADLISGAFFLCAGGLSPAHPLSVLELGSPRQGSRHEEAAAERVRAEQIFRAVDAGGLANLRRVR